MKLIELKNFIQERLPDWHVSVDEAEMVNINLDDLEPYVGAVYVEEFTTGRVSFNFAKRTAIKYEVTFIVFSEDMAPNAEERAKIREERIDPAMNSLISDLHREKNVASFTFNNYPKGFDVAEITQTIVFEAEEATGC